MSVIFVLYSREFVITVIVITEFNCINIYKFKMIENNSKVYTQAWWNIKADD